MALLRLYRLVVRALTLLKITPGKKSVVVLVPPLGKKEFVSLS